MAIRVEIEADLPDIVRVSRQASEAFFEGAAAEAGKRLRSSGSLWPVGRPTKRSKARWHARYRNQQVQLLNAAEYVPYVNNRRFYPSGRPNPNYRAAERTLRKYRRAIETAGDVQADRVLNRA